MYKCEEGKGREESMKKIFLLMALSSTGWLCTYAYGASCQEHYHPCNRYYQDEDYDENYLPRHTCQDACQEEC